MYFSENDPRPFGMPKQVKWARLAPIASHFGHSTITKCLENGQFGDQKSVKNGSKMCFSKDIVGHPGLHKQVEWSHFGPMLNNVGPSQGQKGLGNGPIWDHKWLKNGSKPWFSKK